MGELLSFCLNVSHASIIFTFQRIAYFVSGTLQALGKLVVPEV